jgi:fused signal recognition particle receptor
MFKFLKKRIKKFEDELESEIESELQKETRKAKPEPSKPTEKVKPKKPVEKSEEEIEEKHTVSEEKTVEEPKKEAPKPEIKKEIKPEKTDQELKRERRERDRRKREEELDKQIEKSIESELEHTLRTRRSIEDVVKTDQTRTTTISDEKLDDLLWDLEIGLLESDVAYSVIESIKNDIKEELKHASINRRNIGEVVENVLRNAISNVLMSSELDFDEFINKTEKPVVIMFVGVNGSGKTLSIARVATILKKKKISCVLAAGDTFRAGAIEQLGVHADDLGLKIIKHGQGADPAAVAYDAIEHAKAKHKDVVLLDTAGRIQTDSNLMDEMAKIKRVAKPDLIVFVGDALSGNDAVEQAKRFNEIVGIDGVILTKVDTDAKGGSALSVAYTIGKPLLFIGMGQGYDDMIPFNPKWMIENIFGNT